jgi:transposase InsO family protein
LLQYKYRFDVLWHSDGVLIVGWSLSKHPNAQLAQDAMNNAIARHKPNTSNLMFHSDQGTQYSSKAFIDYCPTITFSTHALSNVVLIAIINKSLRRILSPLI